MIQSTDSDSTSDEITTWIFQANPKEYDILNALSDEKLKSRYIGMLGITKSGSRRGMLHWSGCQARRAESRQSHRSWVIWLKQRKMKRRSLTGCLLRKTPIALCEWSWRSSNNDQHSCLQTRSQSQRIPQIPQYLEVCSRHKLSIHRWRMGCNRWAITSWEKKKRWDYLWSDV